MEKIKHYVYVLRFEQDREFYVGYTSDLNKRLLSHKKGEVESTSYRGPFLLVYHECCLNMKDAVSREKYLKTAWGKRYIKTRIKNYLKGGENEKE